MTQPQPALLAPEACIGGSRSVIGTPPSPPLPPVPVGAGRPGTPGWLSSPVLPPSAVATGRPPPSLPELIDARQVPAMHVPSLHAVPSGLLTPMHMPDSGWQLTAI